MDKTSYEEQKKKQANALKQATEEHMASMAKGFSGVTPQNSEYELEMPSGGGKVLYFPNFTLKQSDIPESKDWEVGKRYPVEVMLEMTSMESRKGKEPTVRFDVVGIKSKKVAKTEDEEDDE